LSYLLRWRAANAQTRPVLPWPADVARGGALGWESRETRPARRTTAAASTYRVQETKNDAPPGTSRRRGVGRSHSPESGGGRSLHDPTLHPDACESAIANWHITPIES